MEVEDNRFGGSKQRVEFVIRQSMRMFGLGTSRNRSTTLIKRSFRSGKRCRSMAVAANAITSPPITTSNGASRSFWTRGLLTSCGSRPFGTTEQGDSGTQFRVDYLKPSGARGFYHPDWVAVQSTPSGEVNWIIETKGRKWEGTTAKDEAIEHWCARISTATGAAWSYVRVDQIRFDSLKPVSLAQLTAAAELPGFVG